MHILFCVNKGKPGTKCFLKMEQFVLPFVNADVIQNIIISNIIKDCLVFILEFKMVRCNKGKTFDFLER